MHFISTKEHRSLPALKIHLPHFVVLTGTKGAGKTHFLEAVYQNRTQTMATVFEASRTNTTFLNSQSFNPSDGHSSSSENTRYSWESTWNLYKSCKAEVTERSALEQILTRSNQLEIIQQIANNANKNIDDLSKDDIKIFYPFFDIL